MPLSPELEKKMRKGKPIVRVASVPAALIPNESDRVALEAFPGLLDVGEAMILCGGSVFIARRRTFAGTP